MVAENLNGGTLRNAVCHMFQIKLTGIKDGNLSLGPVCHFLTVKIQNFTPQLQINCQKLHRGFCEMGKQIRIYLIRSMGT